MSNSQATPASGAVGKFLDIIERLGNKLPDPAVLFLLCLFAVWIFSWLLSGVTFDAIDPRSGNPIQIVNLLQGKELVAFLAGMVKTFTDFPPLGVVLVAMLGVGVAEHSGFISAGLKLMLSFTPKNLLTPMIILVGIVSHTATDAGYVLVIPLGGVIFYAAGRHPLAGIAAAFAGVSGGFSANFVPSAIDPLLQGFTQSAAQLINKDVLVNPLCNFFFTSASSLLIMGLGWFITDRIVEPRLKSAAIDGDPNEIPKFHELSDQETKAFSAAFWVMVVLLALLVFVLYPSTSPFRDDSGSLTSFTSPIMKSIVPLIFILFFVPGLIYGTMTGRYKKTKDWVMDMGKTMSTMGYYIVMAFFCAQFVFAFGHSNLGALLAVKGAAFLQALNLPPQATIVGIIFLTALVNLLVGSASGKWALIAPIFVPMLMQLGISPELTQAAYRVGDSTTNIITPLMPYFPLVVAFCQRYVKGTGIGTLTSIMLPYSVVFLIVWSLFLVLYWMLGIPLGFQASYIYPAG
ncbi:MAG: AbgT family transporter [Acidobacteria bacterium]|nr:AbgT family transporter [Acidobacteriota bacterium]MCB9397339.1 AbgT family transporter [Acidobacteriota bacterium]